MPTTLGGGMPAGAQAASGCELTQVTSSTGPYADGPDISADGSLVAFESPQDIDGLNSSHAFRAWLYDTRADTFRLVVGTNDGGESEPVISADGSTVAFGSYGDPVGQNPGGQQALFAVNLVTGVVQQTTATDGDGNNEIRPALSGDGQQVALTSGARLLFGPTGGTALRDLGLAETGQPHEVSADGRWLATVTSADLTGQNPDRSLELFVYDLSDDSVQQLTDMPDINGSPGPAAIDADGSTIVFDSLGDLTGENADGNSEIFAWDRGEGITQLTHTTSGNNRLPSVSGDGLRVAYVANADRDDPNLELTLLDRRDGSVRVLTHTGPHQNFEPYPSLNFDGTRIAASGFADPVGQNPDLSEELFLATCPLTGEDPPTVVPQPVAVTPRFTG